VSWLKKAADLMKRFLRPKIKKFAMNLFSDPIIKIVHLLLDEIANLQEVSLLS
jgi:hypothetical protein